MLKFSEKVKLEKNDAIMKFNITKNGIKFQVSIKVNRIGAENIFSAYESNELINLEEVGEIMEMIEI